MRKAAFFSLLLALGVLLAACEKEVEKIRLPESHAKLVVHCFISPQDHDVTAYVSRSLPVLGSVDQADTLVKDATITLSDGIRSAQFSYDDSNLEYILRHRAYAKPFDIVPGKVYSLRVTTPRGEVVRATCTVPAALEVPITVTTDSTWDAHYNQYYYRMRMSWPDPPGQVNQYQVSGTEEAVIRLSPDGSPSSTTCSWIDWEGTDNLSDETRDGEQMFSPWGSFRRWSHETSFSVTINAKLLHVDRHYYAYHHSLRRAQQSRANPFAEPVRVYSNVEGGLGIFAAFNETTASVRVK